MVVVAYISTLGHLSLCISIHTFILVIFVDVYVYTHITQTHRQTHKLVLVKAQQEELSHHFITLVHVTFFMYVWLKAFIPRSPSSSSPACVYSVRKTVYSPCCLTCSFSSCLLLCVVCVCRTQFFHGLVDSKRSRTQEEKIAGSSG